MTQGPPPPWPPADLPQPPGHPGQHPGAQPAGHGGPGYAPGPTHGGHAHPGQPQPGAFPGQPQPGAYPSHPHPGVHPNHPHPGGHPGQPQPGAYPGHPQPGVHPNHPHPGGHPGQPQPGAYPGHPQPGVHPGQPQPGAYPGHPQPGVHPGQPQPGAYPGQPQLGAYPGHPQPGAFSGQPQPGAYLGHPQPGVHPGHPQPGAYPGHPQPGAFPGQPQPNAYPGHAAGTPGGPWPQAPRHVAPSPRPNNSHNHLKIIGGIAGLLFVGMALLQNAHEGFDSGQGLIVTALFSLLFGGATLLLLVGMFGAANKEPPKPLLIALPIGLGLLWIGVGPMASTAYCQYDEAKRWAELQDAMGHGDPMIAAGRWQTEYAQRVDDKFERPQWRGQYMLARTRADIESRNVADLRTVLQEIAESEDPQLYAEADQAASAAFSEYYRVAQTKMYAPMADRSGKTFPVDETLRVAFGSILTQLTHAPNADVYVAFTNTVDLAPPPEAIARLAEYRADPRAKVPYPNGVPVIEPEQSFSPANDVRRRRTFLAAMSASFGHVFDAELLTLVPLEDGADREGKIVIEVSSHIVRLPKFFFYDKDTGAGTRALAGLLFGVAVDWKLEVYGRDGTRLYAQAPTRSEPASDFEVSTQPSDPDWGMYSVLMDSAYYNYSRQVTGMFGLEPPAERRVFVYQGS